MHEICAAEKGGYSVRKVCVFPDKKRGAGFLFSPFDFWLTIGGTDINLVM